MTKTLVIILLFSLSIAISGATYLLVAPYYYYNEVVNKNIMSSWYTISNHKDLYISPNKGSIRVTEGIVNESLWKNFHFKNLNIPIPVKNPFFFVAPILKYNPKKKNTEFGISIFNSNNEILSQVYILPTVRYPYILNTQRIFELPVVSNHINKKNPIETWKDIFRKDISEWNIPYGEMVFNLYLLQLRSILINEKAENYYFDEELNIAIIKLSYKDKDYISELVLNKRGGDIYSFLILSKKDDVDAYKIRTKMLREIEYQDTTPSLTNHIYEEFNALEFRDQTDHEGMLFLLSAWSHTQTRFDMIARAIQYLERGRKNQRQLEPLYDYIYRRVGKTFSRRKVGGLNLDPEVFLRRNVELEQAIKKTLEVEAKIQEKVLSVQEQYEKILEDTKHKINKNSKIIKMN